MNFEIFNALFLILEQILQRDPEIVAGHVYDQDRLNHLLDHQEHETVRIHNVVGAARAQFAHLIYAIHEVESVQNQQYSINTPLYLQQLHGLVLLDTFLEGAEDQEAAQVAEVYHVVQYLDVPHSGFKR